MPLFLANLALSSYFLALCYVLATVACVNRLLSIRRVVNTEDHRRRRGGWSTVQLLLLSLSLGCLFRTATFSTLCIFDSLSGHEFPSSGEHNPGVYRPNEWRDNGEPSEKDLDFYNQVVAVLFNLPDFLFVSSYALLVLVWAEAFQSSRRHWFSAEAFRRRWMIFYLIFNGALYLTQMVLYAMLFLDGEAGIFTDEDQNHLRLVPSLIFDVVAAMDLLLPLVIFCAWVYLTLSLSGFPSKSTSARNRLRRVGHVTLAWSLARIVYSVLTLLTFTQGWFNVNRGSLTLQSMLLVVIFLSTELLPIALTLDSKLVVLLSLEESDPSLESQIGS